MPVSDFLFPSNEVIDVTTIGERGLSFLLKLINELSCSSNWLMCFSLACTSH